MAKSPVPICFRVTDAERAVLEAVASHEGATLSEFIRNAAIDVANHILSDVGPQALMEEYAEKRRRETDAKMDALGASLAKLKTN